MRSTQGAAALTAVVAALAGFALGHHRGAADAGVRNQAHRFHATVASLYASGKGGCLRAVAAAETPDAGPEGVCGPFYWSPGARPTVGGSVDVIAVQGSTRDGEDVASFLLTPAP